MSLVVRSLVLSFIAATALSALSGADLPDAAAAGSETAPVTSIPPLPALQAYAADQHIELGRFSIPAGATAARVGDTITTLVSLRKHGHEQQWLVLFKIADLTDAERASKPPPDLFLQQDNSGEPIQFSNAHRLALDIETTGPFSDQRSSPAPATRHARALMSLDFLGLGLDKSCRIWKERTPSLTAQTAPPLSAEESRAGCGFFPALMAFLDAAQTTPGLRDILWNIVQKPSLWSIVRRGGRIDTALYFSEIPALLNPAPWRSITAADVFRMPMNLRLNDQPVLRCALIVTAPRPPLLTCAGIIGIEADPPDGSAKHLSVRLVASRRADANGR
jgi:hypothetical protein